MKTKRTNVLKIVSDRYTNKIVYAIIRKAIISYGVFWGEGFGISERRESTNGKVFR